MVTVGGGGEYTFSESFFKVISKITFAGCGYRGQKISGTIKLQLSYTSDQISSQSKSNFSSILGHSRLKFCLWGFSSVEFESADKMFMSVLVEKLLQFEQNILSIMFI